MPSRPAAPDAAANPIEPSCAPTARAHALRWPVVACGAIVLLTALGTLTPFTLVQSDVDAFAWGRLDWHQANLPDLVANIAVYLPLGFCLFTWCRRWMQPLFVVLLATLCAGGLSFLLESAQSMVATRYDSWHDVVCNATGGLFGAVLAMQLGPVTRRLADAVVATVAEPWWTRVASAPLLVAGWIVLVAATATHGAVGLAGVARGELALHGSWIPLQDYFYEPLPYVVWRLGELAVIYFALAWVATALIGRWPRRHRGAQAVVVLLTIAAAAAGAVRINAYVGVSDLIIGAVAMVLAVTAQRDLARLAAARWAASAAARTAWQKAQAQAARQANQSARRRAFGTSGLLRAAGHGGIAAEDAP
jgi:VanZ family protein